jgi:hypothetical protein
MRLNGIANYPRNTQNHPELRALNLQPNRRNGIWQRKKKATKKKAAKRKTAAKRELIDTGTNKLFVSRNDRGTSFKEVGDVGRSLAADRRQKAKRISKPGQGDKGDRRS